MRRQRNRNENPAPSLPHRHRERSREREAASRKETEDLTTDFEPGIFDDIEVQLTALRLPEIPAGTSLVMDLRHEENNILSVQSFIAARLQAILKSHSGYEPSTTEEGNELARAVNNSLKRFSLKVSLLDGDACGLLAYEKLGRTRKGAFTIRTTAKGKSKKRYAGTLFPELRVVSDAAYSSSPASVGLVSFENSAADG